MTTYKRKNLVSLIKLAQNDDKLALEELVRRHQQQIYNSFSTLNPQADLSDLTQEALVRMSKAIKKLKNPEKFNSWLNQIIHNLFYDSLRKKNRKKEISISNPLLVEEESEFSQCLIDEKKTPDENYSSCELKQKINQAINDLPPLFKTIILLREIDGMSYEEISDLTNLNIGTVKSRIARARLKLQKELEPYLK